MESDKSYFSNGDKKAVSDAVYKTCKTNARGEVSIQSVVQYVTKELANDGKLFLLKTLQADLAAISKTDWLPYEEFYKVFVCWLDKSAYKAASTPKKIAQKPLATSTPRTDHESPDSEGGMFDNGSVGCTIYTTCNTTCSGPDKEESSREDVERLSRRYTRETTNLRSLLRQTEESNNSLQSELEMLQSKYAVLQEREQRLQEEERNLLERVEEAEASVGRQAELRRTAEAEAKRLAQQLAAARQEQQQQTSQLQRLERQLAAADAQRHQLEDGWQQESAAQRQLADERAQAALRLQAHMEERLAQLAGRLAAAEAELAAERGGGERAKGQRSSPEVSFLAEEGAELAELSSVHSSGSGASAEDLPSLRTELEQCMEVLTRSQQPAATQTEQPAECSTATQTCDQALADSMGVRLMPYFVSSLQLNVAVTSCSGCQTDMHNGRLMALESDKARKEADIQTVASSMASTEATTQTSVAFREAGIQTGLTTEDAAIQTIQLGLARAETGIQTVQSRLASLEAETQVSIARNETGIQTIEHGLGKEAGIQTSIASEEAGIQTNFASEEAGIQTIGLLMGNHAGLQRLEDSLGAEDAEIQAVGHSLDTENAGIQTDECCLTSIEIQTLVSSLASLDAETQISLDKENAETQTSVTTNVVGIQATERVPGNDAEIQTNVARNEAGIQVTEHILGNDAGIQTSMAGEVSIQTSLAIAEYGTQTVLTNKDTETQTIISNTADKEAGVQTIGTSLANLDFGTQTSMATEEAGTQTIGSCLHSDETGTQTSLTSVNAGTQTSLASVDARTQTSLASANAGTQTNLASVYAATQTIACRVLNNESGEDTGTQTSRCESSSEDASTQTALKLWAVATLGEAQGAGQKTEALAGADKEVQVELPQLLLNSGLLEMLARIEAASWTYARYRRRPDGGGDGEDDEDDDEEEEEDDDDDEDDKEEDLQSRARPRPDTLGAAPGSSRFLPTAAAAESSAAAEAAADPLDSDPELEAGAERRPRNSLAAANLDRVLRELGLLPRPGAGAGGSAGPGADGDLAARYRAVALAARADSQTLPLRLERQISQRDLARRNEEAEAEELAGALHRLSPLCKDADAVERLATARRHVQFLRQAAHQVAVQSETVGALRLEARFSPWLDAAVRYADSLKAQLQTARSEHDEMRRVLSETGALAETPGPGSGPGPGTGSGTGGLLGSTPRRQLPSASRRRASIAAPPRPAAAVFCGIGLINPTSSRVNFVPDSPSQTSPALLRLSAAAGERISAAGSGGGSSGCNALSPFWSTSNREVDSPSPSERCGEETAEEQSASGAAETPDAGAAADPAASPAALPGVVAGSEDPGVRRRQSAVPSPVAAPAPPGTAGAGPRAAALKATRWARGRVARAWRGRAGLAASARWLAVRLLLLAALWCLVRAFTAPADARERRRRRIPITWLSLDELVAPFVTVRWPRGPPPV